MMTVYYIVVASLMSAHSIAVYLCALQNMNEILFLQLIYNVLFYYVAHGAVKTSSAPQPNFPPALNPLSRLVWLVLPARRPDGEGMRPEEGEVVVGGMVRGKINVEWDRKLSRRCYLLDLRTELYPLINSLHQLDHHHHHHHHHHHRHYHYHLH